MTSAENCEAEAVSKAVTQGERLTRLDELIAKNLAVCHWLIGQSGLQRRDASLARTHYAADGSTR